MVNLLRRWRQWIRPLCVAFCVLTTCVALPLMIVEFHQNNTDTQIQLWFIGGLFVMMALPISIWGILQHLVNYSQPQLQRLIIRILWMVPIYAINAWFAMKFPDVAIYLDTARECYEAYVIYNFMSYLLVFLRMEHENLEYELEQKIQITHLPPICCLPPWKMGSELVQKCKHGVMQYTIIRPVTTVIAFVIALFYPEKYGEGQFKFTSAWLYLMIINNISQIFAMYCLVLFYKAMRDELSPIRPIFKFMCVKAVVFLSFWQSILISILYAVIPNADKADLEASQVQDFCICIEMFLAALGHYFSFSYRPYVDPAATYSDCWQSFWLMWDVSDVQRDVAEHIRHVGNLKLLDVHFMLGSQIFPMFDDHCWMREEPPRSFTVCLCSGFSINLQCSGSTASNVLSGPFRANKPVVVGDGSEITFLLSNCEDYGGYTSTASDISDIERKVHRTPEVGEQRLPQPGVTSESEDVLAAPVENRDSLRRPLLDVSGNIHT